MAKKTENAIRVIVEAAKNYEKYLNNRKFLIIYKTKDGQDFVEVAFHSVNTPSMVRSTPLTRRDTRSKHKDLWQDPAFRAGSCFS